ncbi:unnamed protein product [Euphydryas editha]|uniref:PiggyBac transposable element-derived protein domain-containing protein n=1 Tax=Euphydryas editha TaxID=104508 RepID=A0AAU9UJS0_EUPED|nr:unnamed protein product [Euphydryas editha]
MNIPLQDSTIEALLQEEDSGEENVSEIEDFEEHSEHESETEQEADSSGAASDSENIFAHLPSDSEVEQYEELRPIDEEYLKDVPLKYLRRGKFTGKDRTTQWQVRATTLRVRTRSHNIVYHLQRPIGEGRSCTSMLEAWDLMIPETCLQKIVYYTYIYIQEQRSKFSRERDCKSTDIVELRALLGLLYFCGKLRSSHLNTRDLWEKDGSGCDVCIATMSRERFHFLLRNLRFDDIQTRVERRQTDKLAPFREIFQEINDNFKKYYALGNDVTIDEKLDKTRGRCPFRQYIPSKPGKYGIKILVMADARTYYTNNMEVYVGKNDGPYDHSNSPRDLVKRLVEPIKNSHRNVVMDNWFTSFPLLSDLLNDYGLTALGTLRKNKTEIPPVFTATKGREIHSSLFGFQKNCTVVSYVPKKNKVVLLASTMHHDGKKSTEETKKPEIIMDYNITKCGVDVVDEMCATYSVSRATKRWPLVLFYGLLNVSGINAYVIVKANKEHSGAVMVQRRIALKDLALSLVMPQIKKRSSVPNLSSYIKTKIKFMIDDGSNDENASANTNSSRSRPPVCSSRCAVCEWKKDRKTKTVCELCFKKICREHTTPICEDCYDRVK